MLVSACTYLLTVYVFIHMQVTELPHLGFLVEEGIHLRKRPNGELVGVFQSAPTEGKCSGHQVFDGLEIRVGQKVYNKNIE